MHFFDPQNSKIKRLCRFIGAHFREAEWPTINHSSKCQSLKGSDNTETDTVAPVVRVVVVVPEG